MRARRAASGRGAGFGRVQLGGSLFVAAMTVLAVAAAWPIYGSDSFLILVSVASGVALLLALASRRFAWPGWATTAAGFGALVVLGLGLAVPVYRVGPVRGVTQFFAGLATAWKDLLTVDLPVGEYRNLLVPALVVFLIGPLAALLLSWRSDRAFVAAAPVGLAMQWFGLGFGSDATVRPVRILGVSVTAPREAVIGGLGLLLCVGWLSWRARAERREALRRAAQTSGVRLSRARGAAALRAAALAWLMVIIAVVTALLVTPNLAAGLERDVLRSGTGPDRQLAEAIDPLVEYRQAFTDERFDISMFLVQSDGTQPDRVRLATMTQYDGVTFSIAGDGGSTFRRVPYRRDPGTTELSDLSVTIGTLGSLWQPSAGSLASIDFAGSRAQALGDGFYYDALTDSAVNTVPGGLIQGDSYTAQIGLPATVDVASMASPGDGPHYDAPESLLRWLRTQDQPSDGAGLAELASRLRARGYLSHALTGSGEMKWVAALGPDYTFRPSTAGHSLARIDQLFTALNSRAEVVAEAGGKGSLVAAIGDDEQFSVALALIADQLGFPTRVVVGARLATEESGGIPECEDGLCRGQNLSAWVEVRGADGSWAAIDATPQHKQDLAAQTQHRRDPENPTEVLPVPAREVDPPDSADAKGDSDRPPADLGLNLTWLWVSLRVVAIILLAALVLLAPFLVVLGAKRLRRQARRRREDPVQQITGGWDELVDARIDQGASVPGHQTRTEWARRQGDDTAVGLAERADQAVFSGGSVSAEQADSYWQDVEAERRRLATLGTGWQRWRARVSLASFLRTRSRPAGSGNIPLGKEGAPSGA